MIMANDKKTTDEKKTTDTAQAPDRSRFKKKIKASAGKWTPEDPRSPKGSKKPNTPLVGWFISCTKMPDFRDPRTGEMRAWLSFRVQLSEPTWTVGMGGVVAESRTGDQVTVGLTGEMKLGFWEELTALAQAGKVGEFLVQPLHTREIPGTDKISWEYDITLGDVRDRKPEEIWLFTAPKGSELKGLLAPSPQNGAAGDTSVVEGDEIPF